MNASLDKHAIKLSVAIITLNEEHNIRRCITSVHDLADEVVVVDSYSTDNTESICREFNVRFLQRKFDGHIQQKNFALEQAHYDCVLALDADEALSPELQESIQRIKSDFALDAYAFNRLNNYAGQWIRHCGWYPDRKIRLWRKTAGRWGGDNPHDRVVLEPASSVGHLQGDLLHYSYHSIAHHVQKIDYLTTISAQVAFTKGKKASLLKILVVGPFNFIQDYIFKGGFRDGFYGLVICYNAGYSKYLKYAKLRALWRTQS